MAVRVCPVPTRDLAFRACVRRALQQADLADAAIPSRLLAPSEECLQTALVEVRLRYPDATVRRQDPLASMDGVETWYILRDRDPSLWTVPAMEALRGDPELERADQGEPSTA